MDASVVSVSASRAALYANESLTGRIFRCTPLDERARQDEFANVLSKPRRDRFAGPDGMAFDVDGCLYCAVYGEQLVAVVDRTGVLKKTFDDQRKTSH
jgi:gluconolactonase